MNKLNFKNAKISVIGDIMLDKYLFGEITRISPEAPVPILKINKEEYRPGGAANVAYNIHTLGGQVALYGVIGRDDAGYHLENLLKDIKFLPTYSGRTIEKTRCICEHQLLRIDHENTSPKLLYLPLFVKQISDSDIIIISDYAKGVITDQLLRTIEKTNKKILIDPKPQNYHLYKKCFLITPNEQEALEMTDTTDIYKAGKKLKRKFKSNVIITRGKKGMLVFPKRKKIIDIPTAAREVYDVTGAGDTVIATLALALASNSSLEEAAILANHAAGLAVEKQGTSFVKLSELENILQKEEGKIKTRQELKDLVEKYKLQNKKVIWTNGCFDLLHEGHVHYLKKAKKIGDILIVGLNSDSSVKKFKGKNRPVRSEKARAEILAALESVDYLTIFPETTVASLLDLLKPDVYVKASDYDLEKMNQEERKAVENYNGQIRFIQIEKDISTSKIIDRIKQQS